MICLNFNVMFKKHLSLLMILISLFSCTKSQDGKWDDNIKLSQKNVEFSATNDSIIITTDGESWWINNVFFNDSTDFEISENSSGRFLIQEDEFTVDRRSSTELYIEMTQNMKDSVRTLIIVLQNGNYFDGIKIIQLAE